ncbi:TPA: hypothetical protein DEQ95_04785 [Candidatus Beckwithbacteria bacterium]|nr:MAG: N-acetyltransferase GCN5 [Candidatus Beckwithbacteria bacterium GW2011_GWC1_49_16]KKU34966.1 MAG: GCN5-related N-acetyltransferase [Candidatus Beckwithbacteria bacterium GW2011_GWA1_46_30]KKU71417.1 MAG: GCN5-related N-acetyltransferase [Candidatus Beckwithbacteria bacterium GW2011_GWA2_47_25]KKW03095.1 MAG: GCN5-related N-acetyltransferase [Candidatus Beckwithbacteria bacterium GW2011_GWC2_49_11]OGD48437.1 MAG: hypothetical protein A2877_03270 [Candidatus Beckwithbacteria bacterium RIF
MSKVKIIQSFEKGIVVMHNAGLWMEKSGLKPNKWWKPENMNRNFILKHTEPDEFYVALVGDKPAASMVLQETERNQSWKSVDGDKPKRALYLHWLCVQRDFAGKGFPKVMVEFAKGEAKKRGFSLLRLDTNANEEKLCSLYEGLGFRLMGNEEGDGHKTAFYQIRL